MGYLRETLQTQVPIATKTQLSIYQTLTTPQAVWLDILPPYFYMDTFGIYFTLWVLAVNEIFYVTHL